MPYARKIDCFEFPVVDEEVIDSKRAREDYLSLPSHSDCLADKDKFY